MLFWVSGGQHNSLSCSSRRGADKFNRAILERGAAKMRNTYAGQLSPEKYKRLAEIAHRQPITRDQLTNDLLFNRYALEYRDERNQLWLDVHPVVIEIEDFQRVFNEQRTIQSD